MVEFTHKIPKKMFKNMKAHKKLSRWSEIEKKGEKEKFLLSEKKNNNIISKKNLKKKEKKTKF